MGRSYPTGSAKNHEMRERFARRRQISLQALTSVKPWLNRGVGRQSKSPTPQPVMQLLNNARPVQRPLLNKPQEFLALLQVKIDIEPAPARKNPLHEPSAQSSGQKAPEQRDNFADQRVERNEPISAANHAWGSSRQGTRVIISNITWRQGSRRSKAA